MIIWVKSLVEKSAFNETERRWFDRGSVGPCETQWPVFPSNCRPFVTISRQSYSAVPVFFFFPPSLYFFLREFFFRSIVGLAPLSDTCPRDVLRGTRLFENTRSDPEENGRFSWSGTKLDRCCGPLQSVEKSSLITLFTGQHFNTFSVPSSSSFSECLDPDFSWTWPNNVL